MLCSNPTLHVWGACPTAAGSPTWWSLCSCERVLLVPRFILVAAPLQQSWTQHLRPVYAEMVSKGAACDI